ncbi:MAG: hypothetical protein ATN35_09015 [Epulopiscium sp. Nele67-Bin004]|nr:MAG: hypothetical protein ATN35_09015 [Epulopiscium sp. Nele67-Bin004]
MKHEGLVINTIVSTFGSVSTRFVGMFLMIYISNKIGAEGIGIYQLAMTVYMMAYMIASAGIITSISKLVAEEISRGWVKRAKRVMHIFFVMGILMSLAMYLGVFLSAELISEILIKDMRIVKGLKILSLSIPFMTISACYKGYFYATKDIAKPASSEVFEQIIKLALTVLFLNYFGTDDLEIACVAMSLAITVGEMLSFLYLAILYMTSPLQTRSRVTEQPEGRLLRKIAAVLLPITASSYLTAVFVLLENTLIPTGLRKFGLSDIDSVSIYGMMKGMVLPLMFFPTALLSACSTILTPEIARAQSLRYKGRVESLASRMIHITLLLAFFITTIFYLYGKELGIVLYSDVKVGLFLQIVVVMSPFIYLEIVIDGILKGMGQQKKCLQYRIIDAVLRIILMYVLIPKYGIYGFIATLIFTNVVSGFLHINRLLKITHMKIEFTKWILHPIIIAVAAGLITRTFIMDGVLRQFDMGVKLWSSIAIATVFYLLTLIFAQNITKEELSLQKQ